MSGFIPEAEVVEIEIRAYELGLKTGAKLKETAIIKLLEDFGTDDGKPLNPFHCDLCLTLASLIGIIKGDNK